MSNNNLAKFEYSEYYHIYNRTNNKEDLFRDDDDMILFLELYIHYISKYVKSFSICLLKNHFHFLIQIKSQSEISVYLKSLPINRLTITQRRFLKSMSNKKISAHKIVGHQFTRFFNAYAKRYNILWQRKGNLFYRPFKRKMIDSNFYLLGNIIYIHHNPIHHQLVNNYKDYKWSSFHSSNELIENIINREDLISLFGSLEEFNNKHYEYREFRKGFEQ